VHAQAVACAQERVLAHEIHLVFLPTCSFIDSLNGARWSNVELNWAARSVCDSFVILSTRSRDTALKVLMR
jgi:hypothetical protein